MTPATFPHDRADAPIFADGLGERVLAADATTGELLQVLRLRPELTAVPSFEFALRERTARLMNFRHAYYARVRRVDRLPAGGGLAVISDHIEGTRLSDLLRVTHQRGLQLDTNAALCLIRQLVPAVALLHENARDASHGLIAPERLVVTPHARLVIVEHVIGSGIEQLQFTRERLWQEFRLAIPSSAGIARFDHRADVNGIGITALSLILGRPLGADEVPHAIPQLLMRARERSPMGDERPLSNAFRNWLGRTLQLDVRRAFASAPEALSALEETLAIDSSYVAAPVALETFLAQYHAALTAPHQAAPQLLSIVPPPVNAPSTFSMPPAPPPPRVAFAPPPIAPPAASAAPVPPPALASPLPPAPLEAPAISFAPVPVGTAHGIDPVPSFSPRPGDVIPSTVYRDPAGVPMLAELISLEDLEVPAPAALRDDDFLRPRPKPRAAQEPQTSFDPFESDFDSLAASSFSSLDDSIAGTPPAGSFEPEPEADPEPARARVAAAAVPYAMAGSRGRARVKLIAAVALAAVLIGGGVYVSRFYGAEVAPELGTLLVQSSPAGVEVFVDGVNRGMTPARVSVAAGSHILELRGRGVPRVIPLQVPAGGQISQYLEFADTPTTGMLVVHSQPVGANITVDGTPRGVAPITIEGLSSGDHEVVLQSAAGTSRHTVKVLAGTTASLVAPVTTAPPAAEGPVSGWISVKAPFLIEIREGGQLIGTTETERLMVASGRHTLEFVSQSLGYRDTKTVQVVPGKVVPLTIDLPQGSVNLNASPWAEVWIDGRRVGDTPIGNLAVPIGPHEIIFRHPELGEKKQAVSVTAGTPLRLSVSMK
jgi:serine/threonine protein kinase